MKHGKFFSFLSEIQQIWIWFDWQFCPVWAKNRIKWRWLFLAWRHLIAENKFMTQQPRLSEAKQLYWCIYNGTSESGAHPGGLFRCHDRPLCTAGRLSSLKPMITYQTLSSIVLLHSDFASIFIRPPSLINSALQTHLCSWLSASIL